jgi:arsenate reductase
MTGKIHVLFLCTGNSCRSQLAEALLRHHRGELFEAASGGTDPRPIHPLTLRVLEEKGISTAGLHSKNSAEFLGQRHFGFVIIVCDHAARTCPTSWPEVEPLHMFFDDPAAFVGTDEEKLGKFREVRDQIKEQVLAWADATVARLRAENADPLITSVAPPAPDSQTI